MKDYKSTFIKWLALNSTDPETKKTILNSLHEEVKKGFDVITRVSSEELSATLEDKTLFPKIKEMLEPILALSVYDGYMLYLVSEHIDPVDAKLNKREKTSGLGLDWIDHYSTDQTSSLLLRIDPVISQILEQGKQNRINQLFLSYPDVMKNTYGDIAKLELFINWAFHQGYIFGMLENSLNGKK